MLVRHKIYFISLLLSCLFCKPSWGADPSISKDDDSQASSLPVSRATTTSPVLEKEGIANTSGASGSIEVGTATKSIKSSMPHSQSEGNLLSGEFAVRDLNDLFQFFSSVPDIPKDSQSSKIGPSGPPMCFQLVPGIEGATVSPANFSLHTHPMSPRYPGGFFIARKANQDTELSRLEEKVTNKVTNHIKQDLDKLLEKKVLEILERKKLMADRKQEREEEFETDDIYSDEEDYGEGSRSSAPLQKRQKFEETRKFDYGDLKMSNSGPESIDTVIEEIREVLRGGVSKNEGLKLFLQGNQLVRVSIEKLKDFILGERILKERLIFLDLSRNPLNKTSFPMLKELLENCPQFKIDITGINIGKKDFDECFSNYKDRITFNI